VFRRLRERFLDSPLIFLYKRLSAVPDFLLWKLKGSPGPKVPHLLKQRAVIGLGEEFGLTILIETGTQYGQMVSAARKRFREIYSIELDSRRQEAARRQFAREPHVHLLLGDSAVVLPRLIESITQPCLFWLDAHTQSSPLVSELNAILRHPVPGHVILIDDAAAFGQFWAPTLDDIRQLVNSARPANAVEVRDNIIRILPAPAGMLGRLKSANV
jgi:predicted O-methyltransferase YrrM